MNTDTTGCFGCDRAQWDADGGTCGLTGLLVGNPAKGCEYRKTKESPYKLEARPAMSYKSPIQQYFGQFKTEFENEFMIKASQAVGYEINKEELIKALRYDRNQYSRGFEDGSKSQWISCRKLLPLENRKVLIYTIFDTVEVATIDHYEAGRYIWLTEEGSFSDCKVKYWMPIPELPEEG